MNKAAILSSLVLHEKALENGKLATQCFYEEIRSMDLNKSETEFFQEFQEIMRLLVMSIYNVATEYEYSKDYVQAKTESNKGLSYIRTFLIESQATQAIAKK